MAMAPNGFCNGCAHQLDKEGNCPWCDHFDRVMGRFA